MTGTTRLSIDSLQHLQVYFQVFVPVPVACRRLLRGAECSASADDRSGSRVADPASISTILKPRMTTKRCLLKSEGWAQTKTRWSSYWTCRPTFQSKTCAGWAPQWPHSHAQSARWINFGSFAKACHGKSVYPGFLFFLEQQWAHKYYSLTKNQERRAYHISFNHQRSTKSPSQTQKCM